MPTILPWSTHPAVTACILCDMILNILSKYSSEFAWYLRCNSIYTKRLSVYRGVARSLLQRVYNYLINFIPTMQTFITFVFPKMDKTTVASTNTAMVHWTSPSQSCLCSASRIKLSDTPTEKVSPATRKHSYSNYTVRTACLSVYLFVHLSAYLYVL